MNQLVGAIRVVAGVLVICFWAFCTFIAALVAAMARDDTDDAASVGDLIPLAGIHVVFTALCFAGAYLLMHSVLEGEPEPRQPEQSRHGHVPP